MNLKILTIGAATLGLLAATGLTRAMPTAPLGAAVSQSSDIVKSHYSRYRHVHRHKHIVWLSGPRSTLAASEGNISAGRSVSKHHRRSTKSIEQNAPTGGKSGTQGRSVSPRDTSPSSKAPSSNQQPSGNAPSGTSNQQKGGSQKGGSSY